MKKIFILGNSSSGKSTLAKKLTKLTKISNFSLDDIMWEEKYSVRRSRENCSKELKKLIKNKNSWIIEGVSDFGKIAADKADLLIFLNYSTNVTTYRFIKRWFTQKKDRETIKELFAQIKYIRSYKQIRPNKTYSKLEKHKKIVAGNENKLVEVKNNKQLKELLESKFL